MCTNHKVTVGSTAQLRLCINHKVQSMESRKHTQARPHACAPLLQSTGKVVSAGRVKEVTEAQLLGPAALSHKDRQRQMQVRLSPNFSVQMGEQAPFGVMICTDVTVPGVICNGVPVLQLP